MTSPDQERWLRVKEQLRAEVGEDIFQSWFARMDLERIEVEHRASSVPTRFLKSWIQSHYTDRVLACWQGENSDIQKIEVTVRSAMIRTVPPKIKPPAVTEPRRDPRIGRPTSASFARSMRRFPPDTTRSAARRSIRG